MASLGSQARTVVRGEKNPHVEFEAPLETRAYAIWYAVRFGKVKAHGAPTPGPALEKHPNLAGVKGWTVEVNLTTKARDLWPELVQMDRQSQATWLGDLRRFLNATDNMICVRVPGVGPGDHGQPLWWVRDSWNDVKSVGLYRSLEPTYTERRLSREEAGEDREPAPVMVSKVPGQETLDADQREAVLVSLIKNAVEPLYQQEILTQTGWNHIEVGRLLRKLVVEERLFRRQEDSSERPPGAGGRYRFLYWHQATIPARKTPLEPLDRTIMRINALKPGDSLATGWMSPGPLREVRTLVEAGILEFVNKGTPEERIRLAEPKPKPEPESEPNRFSGMTETQQQAQLIAEQRTPIVVKAPPGQEQRAHGAQFEPSAGAKRLALMLDDLVRAEAASAVADVTRGMREQLESEKQARHRAETALIEARTKLSERERELEQLRGRFEAARRAFSA